MPKVSVVMPVYNGEKYLREAIDSILNQTFSDFEFIIINDCSADSTEQIIMSYTDDRIVYVKNEKNMGVAESLNRGIDLAKGEYIARMDADDISLPERFEKQVKFMDKHTDIGVCGSNIFLFNEDGILREHTFLSEYEDIKVGMLFGCSFAHPSVIIRKSVLKENNFKYNSQFEKTEDYELWGRLAEVCKLYNINEFMLKYRIHKNQVTSKITEREDKNCRFIQERLLGKIAENMSGCELDFFFSNYRLRNFTATEFENLEMVMCKVKKLNRSYRLFNKHKLSKTLSIIRKNVARRMGYKYRIYSFYDICLVLSERIKR